MDSLDFTEEEIQQQLEILGYKNIPKHKLREFKQDLDDLIQRGEWKSLSSSNHLNSHTATSRLSPPAYTKEKLSRRCFGNGDGFFLHAQNGDHDTRVLTTCQNRDYGRQGGCRDSYAQHSVTSRQQLAPGAPNMLLVEPDPEDTTLHPPQNDSFMSTPDSQGRHFIRRKVLRKHNGESLVCDESIYSEDSGQHFATMYKMYSSQWDKESDDDNNSLNSSFWSDGERQDEEDEEERVEIQRMVHEEESKPAAKVEESLQEALGEEKPELHKENNVTEENQDERRTDEDDNSDDDKQSDSQNDVNDDDNEGDSQNDDNEGDSQNDDNDDDNEGDSQNDDSDNDNEGDSQNDDSDDEDHDDNEDHPDDNEDNDEDPNDGERCSSSSGSPAPSLMTSGYGTYRPEEQEAGDYRDNHTITEFDQDSQGDLSEVRDDEDDRSLCSFGGFDIEPTHDLDYESLQLLQDNKLTDEVVGCEDPHEEVNFTGMKVEQVKSEDPEEKYEDLTYTKSEEHQPHVTATEDKLLDGNNLGSGSDHKLSEEYETPEAEEHHFEEEDHLEEVGSKKEDDLEEAQFEEESSVEEMESKEENDLMKVESESEDDSSSNKDIKFIDSKADLSWTTYKMLEEWEGNLRPRMDAASRLEERLADLHLSPSAQHDSETENEDVTSRSDAQTSEAEGMSLTAFESYIRTMTRTQSDGDIRPKPKSFIRPVLSQPTIKKADPVAKYFQYKQLWEMFKLPGEKDRRDLRWEIRERLAYQPPPPKPRRVFVPNTYTVPTEKKRSALRWEIRNDLANGLLPHKYSYRF